MRSCWLIPAHAGTHVQLEHASANGMGKAAESLELREKAVSDAIETGF
jgi:hypothetical protein